MRDLISDGTHRSSPRSGADVMIRGWRIILMMLYVWGHVCIPGELEATIELPWNIWTFDGDSLTALTKLACVCLYLQLSFGELCCSRIIYVTISLVFILFFCSNWSHELSIYHSLIWDDTWTTYSIVTKNIFSSVKVN